MKRDLVCALALLTLAAAYYGVARTLGQTALADTVGPAGLPLVYATVLAGLAVLIACSALLRARLAAEPAKTAEQPAGNGSARHDAPGPGQPGSAVPTARRLRRAAGALAIGIAYVATVPYLGYLLTTALVLGAMAAYQGEKISKRLFLVAGIGAVALYLLFDLALGIDMPGPWTA